MMPIPRGTEEEKNKGIRSLACPYCDDSPFVRTLTQKSIAISNKHFDEIKASIPILFADGIHRRTKGYNYEKGMFCDKCKTIWLWSNEDSYDSWDTYVGPTVPRIREVVIIGGKSYLNFLPVKDWESKEYMPLLHPEASLIKKPSK
jgi:hypothetical protein